MSFYKILLTTHSVVRWLLLFFLVASLVVSLVKWIDRKGLGPGALKINTLTLSFAHLQVIFGLVLYFVSPKISITNFSFSDVVTKYYTINHSLVMLGAIIVLTIGTIRAKRDTDRLRAATTTFLWYIVSLGLIVSALP